MAVGDLVVARENEVRDRGAVREERGVVVEDIVDAAEEAGGRVRVPRGEREVLERAAVLREEAAEGAVEGLGGLGYCAVGDAEGEAPQLRHVPLRGERCAGVGADEVQRVEMGE